jgi:DNA-binding CsgD family transcriptional regulator
MQRSTSSDVQQLWQQTDDRSGTVLLNATGTPTWISTQAAQWLQQYLPAPSISTSLPERVQVWVNHQLTGLNVAGDEMPQAHLPLYLQQGDRQLMIRFSVGQPGEGYLLSLAEERLLSIQMSLELLGLAKRESEVLACLIQGMDTKAIAQQLTVNVSTVRKHLENIYRKIEVQSRTEAVVKALEQLATLRSSAVS